jgi:hypothetical protein
MIDHRTTSEPPVAAAAAVCACSGATNVTAAIAIINTVNKRLLTQSSSKNSINNLQSAIPNS